MACRPGYRRFVGALSETLQDETVLQQGGLDGRLFD
jgi:hypothetical protein